ncbi:MAG TPA: glycoside hydrolase [Candidatus Paceibacterota bacterium]|nr:glycoside hydrolase [Verrucomicrobiota bacterium]HSA10466.1 glycoside hydrolase [Candidatus Paceibacterota bacterium]
MPFAKWGHGGGALLLLLGALFPGGLPARGGYYIQSTNSVARFDPATLEVALRSGNLREVVVSAAQTNLGRVANLIFDRDMNPSKARWSFPDRQISLSLAMEETRLSIHVLAAEPGEFTFPILPARAPASGWILPLSEGVYAPCGDTNWERFLTSQAVMNTTADLTMPFVGLEYRLAVASQPWPRTWTLTCILTNPFNNQLQFVRAPDNTLEARLTHQFTRNHPVKEYAVVFELGTNSLVEPARRYRQWLMEHDEFVSFSDKVRKTPEAGKLPGAAHVYLWGSEPLDPSDVADWKGLARALKDGDAASGPPPARRIWGLLKPEAKAMVSQILEAQWPDRYQKSQVIEALNRLLRQPQFGDVATWQAVALEPDIASLLKSDRSKLSRADLCRLNSHLLAAAFPGLLNRPDTWGNGTSPKMIQQLAAAGLDRLWLGSDDWGGFLDRPGTVSAAKQAGFLIGPYDSYHSIHRPNEPDTWETAQFDAALYATGAIVNADGTKRRGFKKKGYLLSPDAARPYVEKRVSGLMKAFHANSWFIDCDGFGEYFDDYSERHPATQLSDMQARKSRMAWIRDTYGAVIGTEGCSAGVAATVHFAHGVMTPVIGWGDPDLTNKQSKYYLGSYYPPDEPSVFFKPVPLKEEHRYIYFEPRFRLPLFETVFHDSVVATHNWSFASLKAQDEARTVELLELLYQVPPLYHLNVPEFQKRRGQIKRHYEFFSPLHRETAWLPLTGFEWLTPDAAVQRTVFGDKVEVVANFGRKEFEQTGVKVGGGCVVVKRRGSGESREYKAE